MKILALYSQKSLSAIRRVIAPFSVLSGRSYPFGFMQVSGFDAGYAAGYDVTVLPNWALSEPELDSLRTASRQGQTFGYDLAEPAMLQIERVRETLSCCRVVTVPTQYLAKEVKIAVPGIKVAVLPSALDLPYLMCANTHPKPAGMVVGCFGPYDWSLIEDALKQLREEGAKISFLGDAYAARVLGDLVQRIDLSFDTYPWALRQVAFGLLPIERERGQDMIWQHEYGILNKPAITLPAPSMRSTEAWVKAIKRYAHDPRARSTDGQAANLRAREYSSVRIANRYLKAYREMLPHLG